MLDEALEPGQLVVELRARLRIAVGQIDRGDDEAVHRRFQVAAVRVVGVAGKAAAALVDGAASGQDGDAVEALLAVPDGAVARGLYRRGRKGFVGSLQLLQAGDVGASFLEPFDEARQSAVDAIDVEGRDLHGGVAFSNSRSATGSCA